MPRIFDDLNAEQADGLVCVEATCRADFTTSRRPHVPVGESVTGSQVFACADRCAHAVGYRPPAAHEQLAVVADRLGEAVEQIPPGTWEAGQCICGPGCCSPVLGVHTACPGPRVGETVVGVR